MAGVAASIYAVCTFTMRACVMHACVVASGWVNGWRGDRLLTVNCGWLTQVLNQRITFGNGARNSGEKRSFIGYTRADATVMSARVICRACG